MAKETKEERAARRLEEERLQAEATAKYRLTVPARLHAAQALAISLGLQTEVTLTETGPSIRIHDPYNESWDETATYDMEEWNLEYLERKLRERYEEQEAKVRRKTIAQDVWENKLTREEKVAMKEFIHYLPL